MIALAAQTALGAVIKSKIAVKVPSAYVMAMTLGVELAAVASQVSASRKKKLKRLLCRASTAMVTSLVQWIVPV